ncbi:hypothetical protein ILUMI_26924 [Ignelater luminosus]|uniref:Adenosine deaminase n=1 Tax=Ignelater luminosus TaxID=2038154 RepID=A0A8K0C7J5_IGNLU|nr:hypothetical protein ILUMI_26924 [Ignelater luminosus]
MCAKVNLLLIIASLCVLTNADYWKARERFIKNEESQMLGFSLTLNKQEEIANQILMDYKYSEYDDGFQNPGMFAPGRHFFNSKQDVENSEVFRFIQRLPKGGALHGHGSALTSFDYLFSLTYRKNLYGCIVNERIKFKFLSHPEQDKTCKWTLISEFRRNDPDFDKWLRSQLTLDVSNPRETYPNINVVWKAMDDIFASVGPLLSYRPVFEDHFYQALLELYRDNITYLEFRKGLSQVYELNGTVYGPVQVAGFYKNIVDEFKKHFPSFVDARFIYAPSRNANNATVENYIKILTEVKRNYPDFLVGFDLVGQEDVGLPLTEFIHHFDKIPHDIDLVFHAGETNWYGTSTDMNLVDAVLLGTKRIGHGYAIVKHPAVMKEVKERGIAIEICPISNQVLMLVEDMRNHPAAILMAQDYPVVISYDDPSFWSTTGLSYDFYMAFMDGRALPHPKIMLTLIVFVIYLTTASTNDDYWKKREAFIKQEESKMLGSSIILNEKEGIANKILMGYKLREYDNGFKDPASFAPARHFFLSKNDVEKSKVFRFIKKLPKGAALHGHDTAIVSQEYLYNLTFKENLYACTTANKRLRLKFLMNANQDKSCEWTLISELRKENPDYNKWVKSQMTLVVSNPKQKYKNINIVWKTFMEVFSTIDSLILYKPVFQEHFYQALKELYEDNVLYLEFRGTLPTVYDIDGTTYGPMDSVGFYQEVLEQFKNDYPDFIGARFIYGPPRKVNDSTAVDYMQIVEEFKQKYPNFLAGFDLVGQEDLGKPLVDFLPEFKNISSKGIDFFFHAGETDWYGTSTDFNLIDAVLLGTKRIGHGYALNKHPLVLETIKERDIAIEVCPISNQVLLLLDDMRNHPAVSLIAQGYPVVISYDDPSFWGTKGLSYDFYMAFMGIASRDADLRFLKQLAKNSLIYSAMPKEEKELAMVVWNNQWEKFINDVVSEAGYYNEIHKVNDVSVIHI